MEKALIGLVACEKERHTAANIVKWTDEALKAIGLTKEGLLEPQMSRTRSDRLRGVSGGGVWMGDDGVRVCACTVWGGNGSNQLQHSCYCSLPMLNVNVLLLKSLLFLTLLFNNSSTVFTP